MNSKLFLVFVNTIQLVDYIFNYIMKTSLLLLLLLLLSYYFIESMKL